MTLSPRFFADDKFLLQSELRQKNKNSNHIADLSQYISDGNSKGHLYYNLNKKKSFLDLLHNSGYPGIKFEKKIDFESLYKQRSN